MTHTTNTDELDEILIDIPGDWSIYFEAKKDLRNSLLEWSNRRTKAIVDEVIGKDENIEFGVGDSGEVMQNLENFAHNQLRAEQRQTAERLLQEGSK